MGADVLPVLSSLDSAAPNIGAPTRPRTAFLGEWTLSGAASQKVTVAPEPDTVAVGFDNCQSPVVHSSDQG
jgi:hypothetical protein